MAEGPELETEKLQEAIHDTLEREGGRFLRRIALTTAILAAFAAVASLEAGATVNEALLLKTEATRDQAEASDQWAYFRRKASKPRCRRRRARRGSRWTNRHPPSLTGTPNGTVASSKRFRRKRKRRSEPATRNPRKLTGCSNATMDLRTRSALFQIAIALGAVAALTRAQTVWSGSLLVGTGAIVLFSLQWIR